MTFAFYSTSGYLLADALFSAVHTWSQEKRFRTKVHMIMKKSTFRFWILCNASSIHIGLNLSKMLLSGFRVSEMYFCCIVFVERVFRLNLKDIIVRSKVNVLLIPKKFKHFLTAISYRIYMIASNDWVILPVSWVFLYFFDFFLRLALSKGVFSKKCKKM